MVFVTLTTGSQTLLFFIQLGGAIMNKNKNKNKSSQSTKSNTRKKILNSYGYDVSNFNVLDISVRRDPNTGRLISTKKHHPKNN